jgi:hypothetical protein
MRVPIGGICTCGWRERMRSASTLWCGPAGPHHAGVGEGLPGR